MSKNKELPLIIYQNTYFTDSLYSIIKEGDTDNTKTTKESSGKGKAGAEIESGSKDVGGLIPWLFNFKGNIELEKSGYFRVEEDKKITASFKFSEIQNYIGENIVKIQKNNDFENLELGQFVEFTSSYKKNEIRELVDMLLNEDVLDIIFSYLPPFNQNETFFKSLIEEGTFEGTYDPQTLLTGDVRIKSKQGKFRATTTGHKQRTQLLGMIYKIIERLKKDFPDDATTLDFYGQINNTDIRNFLICDTKFFVQEDKNRILDGKFRVFGKVIDIQGEITIESENSIEKAFSQLDRNRFFKRATENSIAELEEFISEKIISSFKNQDGKKWFDSKIDLVTKGKAIKVLPIVIYT
jgi:hypothetical protein